MLFGRTYVNYLFNKKSIWSKRSGGKYEKRNRSNLEVISL